MIPTTEVIVCTYNGAPFVVEQLESILIQTTRVDKISVYDDQSSDNTVSRIHEFVETLPRAQQRLFTIHVNSSNLGYAQNFITAIGKATEEILFLCDQDDVWETRKVECFLRLFQEHGPDMVFSDGSLIDESGRTIDRSTVLKAYGVNKERISHFHAGAFEWLMKRNYING